MFIHQRKLLEDSSLLDRTLSRRSVLRITGAGLILPSALTGINPFRKAEAQEANRHQGPYWLTIHASGGWDPTLLCDPKGVSTTNDPAPINHYFVDEIEEVGNFLVPPVPGMVDFFEEFENELLVINGVDMQTNGHEQGTRSAWSGDMDANRPAFTALVAAATENAPSLAFISNGGYDMTAGFVPVTRLPDTSTVQELAYPDRLSATDSASYYLHPTVQEKVHAAQQARLQRLQEQAHLPRSLTAMQVLEAVRADDGELQSLVSVLPTTMRTSNLEQQVQVAMACFSAGVSVSANLSIGSFDTHGNHDNNHIPKMQELVQAITFIRQEAERLGIADKLNIIVGSDFARTPYYNDGNGKDHWSISSMMFMGPNIRGGRVIGATDMEQLPLAVHPQTLELDANGVILTPGHVHAALRRLANIEEHPFVAGFAVDEWLPLFV